MQIKQWKRRVANREVGGIDFGGGNIEFLKWCRPPIFALIPRSLPTLKQFQELWINYPY